MKVKDVMSKDLIVGYVPGKVEDALNVFAKHNVSGMPILKKETGEVVGVLTRSDIFKNPGENQLAMIMQKNFQFVKENDDVKKAAKLFYEHRIHGLPVLKNNRRLAGVISPTDILKNFFEEKKDLVRDFFTNRAVPVYEETPVNVVMEIINITHENALPVLNDDLEVSGIVTEGDVFKISEIKEEIKSSKFGMGDDEDQWTWEGIRDTIRLYHATSEISFPKVPVKDVMVTNVIKAFRNTPVSEVAEKIVKKDINQMPVVDENNRLIGVITDIDLMKCVF